MELYIIKLKYFFFSLICYFRNISLDVRWIIYDNLAYMAHTYACTYVCIQLVFYLFNWKLGLGCGFSVLEYIFGERNDFFSPMDRKWNE